ncbi:MAG: NADH:ubiquinone oxidoreductase subunit NDUFA12 [Rhizobiaceae bacterium]|nr:NADH:ubiquinone oxidoreductase subunit NDUFA12 [Rhizobiaceae bacterium]
MKKMFVQMFTWWNGSTLGTRFYTWRKGNKVGEDEFGNIYYEGDGGKRWVQYSGVAEASSIPASWHGWMHYRVDTPPTKEDYQPHSWQKSHKPNQTGTPGAYRPKGSIANSTSRPRVSGDYDAWTP